MWESGLPTVTQQVSKVAGWPQEPRGHHAVWNPNVKPGLRPFDLGLRASDGAAHAAWIRSVLPCHFGTRWQEECSRSSQARTRAWVSK